MTPAPPPFALSRTCSLHRDFPACTTVAAWQQQLANLAWRRWEEAEHIRTREGVICVNYDPRLPFVAPGPSARYLYPGQPQNGITDTAPAVYGLRVLDHIDAPVRFLTRAGRILRPHGLLFLTFACWNAQGEDIASGHDQRRRIYDAASLTKLVAEARRAGFQIFGGMDWTYHGHTMGNSRQTNDHSLASLVLTKR